MSAVASPPPSPPSSRRSRWLLLWPLAVAATIFAASGRSQIASPIHFSGLDKVVHALVFGLMATLVVRVFFDPRRPLRSALIAILGVSLYGCIDEFHQSHTPGRSVEVADWIADTSGAMFAVLCYTLWPAYRRLLELAPFQRPVARSDIAPSAAKGDVPASAR